MNYQMIWAVLILVLVHFSAKAGNLDLDFDPTCSTRGQGITLAFTGDVLIHDALYQEARQSPQRFYSLFGQARPLFAKADFTYGNLEGPVALGIDRNGRDHGDVGFTYDLKIYSGTNFSFNYHPSILKDLARVGFNIMSTANNHALDRGSIGIDRTIEAFRQSDLAFVGSRSSQDRSANLYRVTNVRGANIAWISCTEMTNGISDTKSQLLACMRNGDTIVKMIRGLSTRADIDAVLVTPHWGEEYSSVNAEQRKWGHAFLEAGATAVIGSHPHVLQPWEKYVTADGRETLIAYSLGNFLAYQAGINKKTGAVVYLKLANTGSGKLAIQAAAYTTTYRDGFTVFPTDDPGINDYAAKFLGTKNRRSAKQKLWGARCE